MKSVRLCFASLVFILSVLPSVHADLLDTSASFEVVRVFYDTDENLQAAATSDGFVVVWDEYYTAEGPGVVYGCHLDLQGEGGGSDFPIAVSEPGRGLGSSALQSFTDGTFIVSWVDYGEDRLVRARRFDFDIMPIGTEFVVTGPTTMMISDATVAAAGDGSFLVVWRAPVTGGSQLQAVRYDVTGSPLPGVVKPSDGGSFDLGRRLSASGDSEGNFVVVWTAGYTYETGQAGGYYPYTRDEGRGRVILADGTTPDPIFGAGGQYGLNVGHLSNDGFVVSWSDSYRSYDVYPAPLDAYASIHQPDGSSVLQVSERLGYDRDGPNTGLASTDDGFVVAWTHYSTYPSGPEDTADVFVRQFGGDGRAAGRGVPLELDLAAGRIADPEVAVSGDHVLVAWHEGDSIRGQILRVVDEVLCGDATVDGLISATDALGALAAAVGARYCSRLLCDADGDGTIDATDALLILQAAINDAVTLSCD